MLICICICIIYIEEYAIEAPVITHNMFVHIYNCAYYVEIMLYENGFNTRDWTACS